MKLPSPKAPKRRAAGWPAWMAPRKVALPHAHCSPVASHRRTCSRGAIGRTVPLRSCAVRLLVVDDEPEIRLLVQANLRLLGHECLDAGTAAEAMPICRDQHPDALLLDVAMPDIDGRELLRLLREDGTVPRRVVLFSALPPNELAALARQLDVDW